MRILFTIIIIGLITLQPEETRGQSPSFETFVNPVIPGDHPDPTLTKIDNYFYTSGSSFNPTPKIYRSTNLVHWEVIAQPVTSEWNTYGDSPGGGVWGGHTVRYNNKYWHFFGRGGGNMYFVTANQPTASWSDPTRVEVPAGLNSHGVDNSLFIDDDTGKWYMLTKAGETNNHIVELGDDGQPTGEFLDLTWLNPEEEGLPYGWAEGPVMWKYNGTYYYSFAQHLVGEQYVMKSDTLTDNPDDWTVMDGTMFYGGQATYNRPNHISPAVLLEDSTSWVIGHSYHSSQSWKAHGRQGLLMQVTYDEEGWPRIQYPSNNAQTAPALPNNTPWMVPKSDMFNSARLSPMWSFLGFTPEDSYSLSERAGWLYLTPHNGENTLIQNDGEHQYALITRVDFEPETVSDQAGLWIFNGPETLAAKVYSTVNAEGENILVFSFDDTSYEVPNTLGQTVWLKLVRDDHMVSGYYSTDGSLWTEIGEPIDAVAMDQEQTQFNDFTGNQQGIFIEGKEAYFDSYIYRDAYSTISAKNPANKFGVSPFSTYLSSIHNDDWALYAGVEFGDSDAPSNDGVDYQKSVKEIQVTAASGGVSGSVEVWIDAIETGELIGTVEIEDTGGLTVYHTFNASVIEVSGNHDVYLRFKGETENQLFRIESLRFSTEITTSAEEEVAQSPTTFTLSQNYPNPFNPVTQISYSLQEASDVTLTIYDITGRQVQTLMNKRQSAGKHTVKFDAQNYPSGVYLYRLGAGSFSDIKRMVLIK
jgi:beta-xylosidase